MKLLWAASLLLLAACQPSADPSVATNPSPSTTGFRCPPAGTQIRYGTNNTVIFEGADPADPAICHAQRSGSRLRLLYGFMHLPAFDERRLRAGLDRLFPLQVGKESTFGWLDSDTRNLVMSEWRVVRTDDLSIDGDVRRTLVVERRQRAHYQYLGSSLDTFWFDPELGIPLKQTGQVYIGAPAWSRNWTARQLSIARTPVE